MKAKTSFPSKIYLIFVFIAILTHTLFAQYGWPTGLNANQQQNITSTFMEYRPGRYHVGIDITPIDGHWNTYNVTAGFIDDIERFGFPNEHNERILVDGFSYIHVDVNDSLQEGMWIDIDTWLGSIYDPNPLGRHLHFEDGGQFVYGYAYNPFDCSYGIQPYTDNTNPNIFDITFHRQPSGITLSNTDINGNVDIRVNCNDPVNLGYYGAVYELAYQIRTLTGEECGLPNWNIRFDYWTTNSGFGTIWHSDDHIWVSNFLDPTTGQSSDEYWNSTEIRNGDFRMYIIATDLNCLPHQVEYFEDITINNPAQVKTNNIQNTSEIWKG